MYKYLLTVLFGIFILFASAQKIELGGVYQGENIYVMNPFSSSGVGFCIQEVRVNDRVSTDEISSSAFEIDLSQYNFKLGDPIRISIKHKEGCLPKIINPNVIQVKSTFKISTIEVGRDQIIRWSTTNETGALDYYIEQFRWNKWVRVGSVKGKGSAKKNQYTYKITAHSGQNKFRVKQIDFTKKARYSKDAIYRSMSPEVTFKLNKSSNKIEFSSSTSYEIYNSYGNIEMKGNGKFADIQKLKSGNYYLNFDNKMDSFKKK